MKLTSLSTRASFVASVLCGLFAGQAQSSASDEASSPAVRASDDADQSLQSAIGRALREADLGFIRQVGTRLPGVDKAWQAPNRERNLRVLAHEGGVHLTPFYSQNDWHFGVKLGSIERAGEASVLAQAELVAEGDRVEYRRAGLTEWYLNSHDGVEQVITLQERPLDSHEGALVLGLDIDSTFAPSVDANGLGVSFDDCGEEVLRYAGLSVFDADGRSLDARFVLADGALSIEIDDAEAVYPLTVDPMMTNSQTPIQPSGAPIDGLMGYSIDVHGDTAVIGQPGSGDMMGTAYVLRLIGLNWSVEAKLDNSVMDAGDRVGFSVAVHGDIILLGSTRDEQNGASAGRVVVMERNAQDNWNRIQNFTGSATDAFDLFGYDVSLGLRFGVLHAAVGAPGQSNNSGVVYVFRFANGLFVQDQIIDPPTNNAGDFFGASVDLDEARLIAGAPFDDDPGVNRGRVFVYRHTGFVWEQTQILDSANSAQFGRALDLDGDSLIVGSASGDAYFYRDDPAGLIWDGFYDGPNGAAADVGMLDDGNWKRAIVGDVTGEQVRIFEKVGNSWPATPIQTLDVGTTDASYGGAVKLEGIYAFVGAPNHDILGEGTGQAYAYRDIGNGYGFAGLFSPTNADEDDAFGAAVAVDGQIAVVGADEDDDCGFRSGAAYVFERDGGNWTQTAKLIPGANASNAGAFGHSVDVEGQRIVVGAVEEDSLVSGFPAGSVYTFTRQNGEWALEQRLEASDGESSDDFGNSVSISGNRIAVGSPEEDEAGDGAGAVYLFERMGGQWVETEKLVGTNTDSNDSLGTSVAIQGETIMAGAPNADNENGATGAVYVFRIFGGAWSNSQILRPLDDDAGDDFGQSVALDGDRAVFGAPLDDEFGSNAGAAYTYWFNTVVWLRDQKLAPQNIAANDRFGGAVSMSGNWVAIGSIFAQRGGATGNGTAYFYHHDGIEWTEDSELVHDDPQEFAATGFSVAVDGITAVVGARRYDTNVDDSGRAIVVVFPAETPTTYCTAKQTSCGNLPFISYLGESSASAVSGFDVRATGVPGGKFGLLFYSDQGPAALPFDGGFLCVQPALRRSFPFPANGTPGTCNGTLSIDMNRFAAGLLGGNPQAYLRIPGTQINCQFWGRDLPNRSMLSNGLEYVVGG